MFPEGRALEFLIVAIVALIVVGPKDLPMLLRKLGQFMAKLRGMAAEFRASFDEMARQSELDELRKEVEAMRRGQFADAAKAATTADVSQTFDEIHKSLADGNVQLHPPMSYQYETPAPEPETPAKTPRARKARAKPAAKAKATAKTTAKRPPAKAAAPRKAPAKPRTRKITEPGA